MRISIIITYSFAILFIIVSFFLFAKLNRAILHFEENSIYPIAVAISNICFVLIDFIFLLLLTNNYAFFFLLFIIPLIYLLFIRNPCSNRISQHEFGEIISLKFIFAVFASLASIFAYLNENTVLYILSPILTLILPAIIQLICISKKIGLKHYRMNGHIVYNSDLYKIKRDTKTAELQKKGNRNNILFSEIVCGDKTFPIDSYDRNAFDEYKLDSLTIQNGVFLDSNIDLRTWKNPNGMKNVVLDCNCSRNGLRCLIHTNLNLNNLITTNNCKSQVKNFNIVVSSSKLNLYFCSRSAAHLTIVESCKIIHCNACYMCVLLTFVYFPRSVRIIENSAFQGCRKLQRISFHPNSQLGSIGDNSFSNTAIKQVVFSRLLCSIGS